MSATQIETYNFFVIVDLFHKKKHVLVVYITSGFDHQYD